MNEAELALIIAGGESSSVEFKETLDEEATESIAALANAKGGLILIGIDDHGTVKGVTLGKESLRDWANQIAQATPIHPQLTPLTYQGKTIVAMQVDESQVKPVRGRYFKRVGKSNRKMTDDDITRAILDKVGMSWDEVPEPRATLADLDPAQMQRFRTLCNQKGRRRIPDSESDTLILEKLGLLRAGQVLRAALLMFGKEPQRFYPTAFVKIGRFRSPTNIIDDREIYGTLVDQVDETLGYFRQHLQTSFAFEGEAAREVIWEYPLEALREAITNTVCHRDYLDTAHTQVRWYDDRVMFINSGGLLPPLRLEDLKREHKSNPRNRKIAEMFYYAGLIERWGSGIEKMLNECVAAGLPEPSFEEKQGGLWLTFQKDLLTVDYLNSLGLNARQVKAVLWVKEHGRITNAELQHIAQTTSISAKRDLADLVDRALLTRVGAGRNAYYTSGQTSHNRVINGSNGT
jgi:ATP-dependent DNA helicase RecG